MTAPAVVVVTLSPDELAGIVEGAVTRALAAHASPEPSTLAQRLTLDALAHLEGVSRATIRRLMHEDGAPVHFIGASPRFELAEWRAWCAERGRVGTKAAPSKTPERIGGSVCSREGRGDEHTPPRGRARGAVGERSAAGFDPDPDERQAIQAENPGPDSLDGPASDVNPRERDGDGGGTSAPSRRLADILAASLARVDRRCSGVERPIALPWPVLADHFGGGFWPGLHILNSGTGVGKTQWALQVALCATKAGTPALYIGLELADLDLALRVLGGEAAVPWSHLWTGRAGPLYVARAHAAAPALADLPFHFEVARPFAFAVSDLRVVVEAFRAEYPEADGPGSRPLLVVVDFLQLVGDEPRTPDTPHQRSTELRERIGRASYALRDFASRLSIAVLAISSIARERYQLVNELHAAAKLAWDEDEDGCPVNRRILNVEAIVGAGKESGELEYSADSVTIMGKVPGTWSGHGCDVVIATAKGRATGATWSPLHFDGFTFTECTDRGGRTVEAWKDAADKRAQVKEAKVQAKDAAKEARIVRDAAAVAAYVLAHPGRPVAEARVHAVGDSARRWKPAVAKLGAALQEGKRGKAMALTLDRRQLPVDVASIMDHGHSPL